MFKNYLKIAFRRFWRQKLFTIINVLGLSSGLAIAMVMWISIQYQKSFDSFHEHGNDIYKLSITYKLKNEDLKTYTCAGIWAEEIQNNYPEVKMKARLINSVELLFNSYNENGEVDKKHIESKGAGVDTTFFQMFSFPLLQGKADKVFSDPYSIVLSHEFAQKYFGDENPIGKTLEINREYNFKVTGVLEKLPLNTQLGFDFYIPVSFFKELGYRVDGTIGNDFQTYFLLEAGATKENMDATLQEFLYSRFERDVDYEPYLLPLVDMSVPSGSLDSIINIIFSAIAIFILLMACINFMNLSTATSLKRAKEIAIRKIVGAHRKQLIKQLLGESILLAFISLNIAIVLTEYMFEILGTFSNFRIPFELGNINLWIQLILLALLTGLLAGSYPAMFLSSFKPVKVLAFNILRGGGRFRKILVVFQFVLTIIFLTITISAYRQYQAIKKNKKGLELENIVSVPITGDIYDNYELIKSELLTNSNILSVTTSDQAPTWIEMGEFLWGTSPGKNENLARLISVNYDFLDVFNIRLKEGRAFSKEFPGDAENSIIINEEIVQLLKIEDPIGKQFYLYDVPYTIIGVVEYFDFFSLEMGGKTLIIRLRPRRRGNVYIKYRTDTYFNIDEQLEQVFEKQNPNYPYEYSFYSDLNTPIDDGLKNIYKALAFFTVFGIFIAILGLLGLTAFMVEQKTKEIGIRKAMGASVREIVSIITKQFFKLILIANIIALPISYLIHRYSGSFFTVKTRGDIFVFILVFLFIFILAFILIFIVTIKAARANPAKSLRYE